MKPKPENPSSAAPAETSSRATQRAIESSELLTEPDLALVAVASASGWLAAEQGTEPDGGLGSTVPGSGPTGGAQCTLGTTEPGEARAGVDSIAPVVLPINVTDDQPYPDDLPTHVWSPDARELVAVVGATLSGQERYHLVRLHAKGGIGQIWLARDEHLGREVALKELKPKRAADALLAARFLQEARIAGQLEHPGIVPIYDLAESQDPGRSFYTMRFVRGRTLSEAIKAYHKARLEARGRGLDRRALRLELRALINALVMVCQAVAFAHSRGVIHRDIKPQNVVLGDFGEVMVLDWGLAKVLGAEQFVAPDRSEPFQPLGPVSSGPEGSREDTHPGEAIGTPAYMSPEQASGEKRDVGLLSDIYGLGTILYDILTGRPPYRGETTREILSQVCEGPPPRPREVCHQVHPALEAICLKATARAPENRYATALEMTGDLQHWLADEAVGAWREPWHYHLGRWMRRHRSVAPALVGVMATISIAAVTSNHFIADEKRVADRARFVAESDLRVVRRAIDQMLYHMGDESIPHLPQTVALRLQFNDEALRTYMSLYQRHPNDPGLILELAHAHHRAGELYRLQYEYQKALDNFTMGRELMRRLLQAEPANPEAIEREVELAREIAALEAERGHLTQAEAMARTALQTASTLRRQSPQSIPRQRIEGRLHRLLATILVEAGQFSEALSESQKSVNLWLPLANHPHAAPYDGLELVAALDGQGQTLLELDLDQQAVAVLAEAMRRSRLLQAIAPKNPDRKYMLAHTLFNWASALLADPARSGEAELAYTDAEKRLTELSASFPDYVKYRVALAEVLERRGRLRAANSSEPAGKSDLQEARKILEAVTGDHPEVFEYQELLGCILTDLGRAAVAENNPDTGRSLFQEALTKLERAHRQSPDSLWVKRALEATHAELDQLSAREKKATGRDGQKKP